MPQQRADNKLDFIANILQSGQQGVLRGQQLQSQADKTGFERGQQQQQLQSDLLRNQILNQATQSLTQQRGQQTKRTASLFGQQDVTAGLNQQILEAQLAQEQFKASPEFQSAELAKKRGTGKSTRRPLDVVGNVLGGLGKLESKFETGQKSFLSGATDIEPTALTAQDSLNVIQNALNFGANELSPQQLDSVVNILNQQGAIPRQLETIQGLPPINQSKSEIDKGNAQRLAESTDEYKSAKTQQERDAITQQILNALKQRFNDGDITRNTITNKQQ